MKRTALILILTMITATAAAAEGPEYATSVIGTGTFTFDQPRAIYTGLGGAIYLVEGDTDWATGRMISADLASSTRFKPAGKLADNSSIKWFHPASIHPTSSGDLLVADTGRRRILRLNSEGEFRGVLVPADSPANLQGPTDAVRLSTGEIVVCDSASSRLVLCDPDGGFKRVLASPGTDSDQVSHPFSLTVDPFGRLWTVDTLNRRLVCRGTDLSVSRVVRPQQADGTLFQWPSFLAVQPDGNLLVADDGRSCVFRLTPGGEVLARLGMRDGERQVFGRVSGVAALPDGTVLATDALRNVIVRFAADGSVLGEIGWPHLHGWNGGRLVAGGVDRPGGFYLVESAFGCRVRYFDSDGVLRAEFGGPGAGPGKLLRPRAAAVGPDGTLFVADSELHRITVWRADGSLVRVFGRWGAGRDEMRYPRAIAVAPDGSVYVGDAGNRRIQVYTTAGAFVRTLAGNLDPLDIDVDRNGRVAVYDDADDAIVLLDREGRELARADASKIRAFSGMAFAPDGRLLVLDGPAAAVKAFVIDPDKPAEMQDYLQDSRIGWSRLARGAGGRAFVISESGIRPIASDKLGALVSARVPVAPGKLLQPGSLALVWGNALAVLSDADGSVQVFGRDGTFRRVLALDNVRAVTRVAAAANGDLLLLASAEGAIWRVDPSGKAAPILQSDALRDAAMFSMLPDGGAWAKGIEYRGRARIFRVDKDGKEVSGLSLPGGRGHWGRGFSVTPAGDVLVYERGEGVVTDFAPDGAKRWSFDAAALAEPGKLRGISAGWADPAGETWLLGGDWSGIRVYGADRAFLRAIKSDPAAGGLSGPSDFAVDADGAVYIADTGNNRVVKLSVKKPAAR